MNTCLVIGGSSGIGLSLALKLAKESRVIVIDKQPFPSGYSNNKITFECHDLTEPDLSWLDNMDCIDGLFITAGFGHLAHAWEFSDQYMQDIFAVNAVAPVRILRHFLSAMLSRDFTCAVMVSIAGRLASPLFSAYSATKAALSKFIEAANIELEAQGCGNRILEVSPGSIKGTAFTGGKTDLKALDDLAGDILRAAAEKRTLLIPDYDTVFKNVIERYHADPHKFALESYQYKMKRKTQAE